MVFTSPLEKTGVRHILKILKRRKWTVRPAPNSGGYLAMSPNRRDSVTFAASSSKANVYAEFRRVGIELDGRRPPGLQHTSGPTTRTFPFASLAPLLYEPEQKPLVEIPVSVQRTYEFSDHALERINERNIGIFEVWSALHEPDLTIPNKPAGTAHFIRGDVEVVVNAKNAVVATVIDIAENKRLAPRVALAPTLVSVAAEPVIQPVNKPSIQPFLEPVIPPAIPAPDEEKEVKNPKPEVPTTKVAHIRAALGDMKIGTAFTVAELVEKLKPLDVNATNVMQAMSNYKAAGHITHTGPGEYVMRDPDSIRNAATRQKPPVKAAVPAPRQQPKPEPKPEPQPEPQPYVRPASGTVKERVRALVAEMASDREITGPQVLRELGHPKPSAANVSIILKGMAADGTLVDLGLDQGTRVFMKKTEIADVTTLPTRAKAKHRAPDEDDYDVAVGFNFEPLPKSDVFDLVDQVIMHRRELEGSPWSWARIATYEGGRAVEVASMRAAKLEAELSDPRFGIEVRRVSVSQVAMFISYKPGGPQR